MRPSHTIILAMVLVTGLGQTASADRHGWISLGGGPNNLGAGTYFTASAKPSRVVFSIRLFMYEEAQPGWFNDRDPNEHTREFSFLIGVGEENAKERIRMFSAGLGLVNSVRRGKVIKEDRWFAGPLHEKLTSSAVGLALHGEYYFSKRFGLSALANFNDAEPFASACLCVRLFSW
jgi:hypothetical protein